MEVATYNVVLQERRSSTIQRLENEKDRLRRERDTLRRELENTHGLVARYKAERDAVRMELGVLHKEVSLSLPMNVSGTCLLTCLPRQLSIADGREKVITQENRQLKDLLDIRRQELKDAQRFMGTIDTSAESDVVEEVRGLNTEVFNLARSVAERASPTEHDQNQRRGAEKLLVEENALEPFFQLLKSAEVRDDAMLEIAMQVVATTYLARVITAWTGQTESDAAFSTVYEAIQRSGKPHEG